MLRLRRIMSAIDFRATVEKVHEEGADRVKLTFVGKWREYSLRDEVAERSLTMVGFTQFLTRGGELEERLIY